MLRSLRAVLGLIAASAALALPSAASAAAPVCPAQSLVFADPGAPATLPTCTDVDGDPLTYVLEAGGAAAGYSDFAWSVDTTTPNRWSFSTAATGGLVDLLFHASDGAANSLPGRVAVAVGGAIAGKVTDGNPSHPQSGVVVVAVPSGGGSGVQGVTETDGTYVLAGLPNGAYTLYFGGDEWYTQSTSATTLTVGDHHKDDVDTTVQLVDASMRDLRPSCAPDARPLDPGGAPMSIDLRCGNVYSDPLTYTVVSQPAHGTVSIGAGGVATYTPSGAPAGPDGFVFIVDVAGSGDDTKKVLVKVDLPYNRAPSCQSIANVDVAYGTPTQIPVTCTDPDGDARTLVVDNVVAGSAQPAGSAAITYTPVAGTFSDTITFHAKDSHDAAGATADIHVTVGQPPAGDPGDDPPADDPPPSGMPPGDPAPFDPAPYQHPGAGGAGGGQTGGESRPAAKAFTASFAPAFGAVSKATAARLKSRCVVPNLKGKSLTRARTALKQARCALGRVSRVKRKKGQRKGVVVKQSVVTRTTKAKGAKVSVTLTR